MSDRITHLDFKLNRELIATVMNEHQISVESLSFFTKIEFFRLLRILEGRVPIQLSELIILSDSLRIPINSLILI